MAVRSKTWFCSRSLAEITGLNRAGAWVSDFRECCVLSDRDICFGLMACPEEFYQELCV
jgi:hypothetical protein